MKLTKPKKVFIAGMIAATMLLSSGCKPDADEQTSKIEQLNTDGVQLTNDQVIQISRFSPVPRNILSSRGIQAPTREGFELTGFYLSDGTKMYNANGEWVNGTLHAGDGAARNIVMYSGWKELELEIQETTSQTTASCQLNVY
jgi:hypothetical protein